MNSLCVTIEKLVYGGDGLARLPDGQIAFVPQVLPGEQVRIQIVQKFGDYVWARPVEILSPAQKRQEPPCSYYPACGGCQWQHIAYPAQLEFKLQIFKETLSRLAGLGTVPIEGVHPSPRPLGYRHRLQFHVHSATGALGFLKRRSHDLVPLRSCALATPEINQVMSVLPDLPAWKRLHPYVKRLNLGTSLAEGLVTMLLWIKVEPRKEDLWEIFEALPVLKAIFYWVRGRFPIGPIPEEAPDNGVRLFPVPPNISGQKEEVFFQAAPGVFVQNNWEINLSLIEYVRKIAGLSPGEEVLDLHCGMGNFLLPLSLLARGGKGVDTDPRAIKDARANVERWGLEGKQVHFEVFSAMEALLECLKLGEVYPLVLLDPPRGGCKELLRFLPDIAIDRLLYVSCDPPALARDLKILIKQGFCVECIKVFDMFPQTYHSESVVLLRRA